MEILDFPGNKHTESILTMNDGVWYAVYTASRSEKKVKERLDEKGIVNYLPLRTEVRIWSDRKKKVSVPLIAGYIFVCISEVQYNLVLEIPGVVTFLKEKGKAVAIPADQIERLHFAEDHTDEPLEMSFEHIAVGSMVEVVRGRLAGFRGEMVQIRDKYRIVIRLDRLGCALITVAASCVNWEETNQRISKKR